MIRIHFVTLLKVRRSKRRAPNVLEAKIQKQNIPLTILLAQIGFIHSNLHQRATGTHFA